MVLNQEPSAQLGTMNHSLNPRLSTQPGSNLIRLVLSHRLVFFNYDDFGGRWTVDGRRILVFPAFSNSFFASCEAASLSRTFLRASLPRASEPHFLAKPALRPRTLFRALRPGPFLPSLASPNAFLGNGSSQHSANIGSSDGSSLTVNLNQKVSAVFVFDDE